MKKEDNRLELQIGRIRISHIQHYLYVGVIALLSLLYLARDLKGVVFPDIVFSGICGISFFILDYGSALGIYIFTTGLTLPHSEIRLLYVCFYLVKKLSSGGIHFHKRMFTMTAILLVLQMVDMTLFSRSGWTSILYDYVTSMLYIVIPLLWYIADISAADCRKAMLGYMWSAMLGAAIIVVLTAKQVGWSELLTGSKFMRLGATVNENGSGMQSAYNANQLGGMMAITVSLALVLMEKKKVNALLGMVVCGAGIVVIALTKSRTGLLCTGGAIMLYILYTAKYAKSRLKGILFASGIALIILLLRYIEPKIFDGIMSRFIDQEDITNGRSDLLVVYLQEWSSNPWSMLFGYGIKSFQQVVVASNVPHNALADVLICWGLTGFLLVAGILISFFRRSMSLLNKQDRFLASIPAIVAFVFSMAGQYLTAGYPHMRLCFLLLVMQALSQENAN